MSDAVIRSVTINLIGTPSVLVEIHPIDRDNQECEIVFPDGINQRLVELAQTIRIK